MAASASSPADLPLEQLALYHAVDPCLSSVLVFYGPVATANATVSSSRIQAHIFSPAGFQSYPRITVSPAAPLYAAVHHLPREKQGDEVCRGLAVSLYKYFAELADPVKACLSDLSKSGKPGARYLKMFDETHAADLANRMAKVENTAGIIRDVREAYRERKVPWIDVDVVLPAGTIQPPRQHDHHHQDAVAGDEAPEDQYGRFTPLIRALGDPIFLPTSRLRRAPSQPTNLSKSKLFTKIQKESLRLAMCEVVDTEERYVAKLYDLVHNVVDEFRRKAKTKPSSSTSPDESALAALFPPCLNDILETNMGFLDVIRQVLEETEKDALADISEDTDLQPVAGRPSAREAKDPLGAIAFANALLEWFPRFSKPYAEYMRAHTGFTQTLNNFLKDSNSSFSKRVYETGEQRLRSLLMEPVQRLPRYSLLIDTMTSNLPLVHPAVRPFLKARDIINDICSLDNSSSDDHSQSLERVKNLVDGWPSSVSPAGRLITAVDFNEIPPPYRIDAQPSGPSSALMLLYKNCLVLLSKAPGSKATARGLLAEVDNPATSVNELSGSVTPGELRFARVFDLNDVRFMQSACGRVLYLIPAATTSDQSDRTMVLALELAGMYDGRANRLIEEILKAKIEGRFSEQERESGKWTLRSPVGTYGNVGILASVFEEDQSGAMNRSGSSNIRVVFDIPKALRTKALSSSDLEVIVSISSPSEDGYRVDIDSVVGASTTDTVAVDDFIPVLSRRLFNLLSPLHHPKNPVVTEPIIYSNFEILRCVASHLLAQAKVPRGFRPPSPSKLFSTLWGGGQSKEHQSHSKASGSSLVLDDNIPKMAPPKVSTVRPATSQSTTSSQDEAASFKISVVGPTSSKHLDDHLKLLEQTFTAYVLALQSRSGNIVGRTLRARGNVDRAVVNELYNVLLEDPGKIQAAAEVPVDVLFVAFETFMSNAWRDYIGPVIAPSALKLIQSKFDSMIPGNFEDCFRQTLAEMSPQNRRALTAMVRLLAELLDASGNDGDRGALMAAFAEILTVDGDPMQYVSLLDRMVDDFEKLFDDSTPVGTSIEGGLVSDPSGVLSKSQSSHTGSMSSNASSFRKRFGFGLHRENSKSEGESKVSSILRTLSKNKGSGDSESSTPKGSLLRSKSTDTDTRLAHHLRPSSRDRPAVYGAFAPEEQIDRADSALHSLSTSVGEGSFIRERAKFRRKRRSSLSDLRPQSASSSEIPALSPIEPLRPLTPKTPPQRSESDAVTPTRQGRPPSSHNAGSPPPLRPSSPIPIGSPTRTSRKENVHSRSTLTERAINMKTDGPNQSPKKRTDAYPSATQSKNAGLKERSALADRPESPVKQLQPSASSPQKPYKLRMHSPQKLRERIRNEKKAQASAESSLQAELALISEEISALKLQPSSTYGSTGKPAVTSSPSNLAATLMTRVRNLESRLATLSSDLENRTTALEKDLETSLIVSERRVKKLDELYREASAENEALYERFNAELSKVVKDIRLGEGEEALKTQLREALEELGRVKKENLRLKREISGLRAQQADGGPVRGE